MKFLYVAFAIIFQNNSAYAQTAIPSPAAGTADSIKIRVKVKGKGDIIRRAEIKVGQSRFFSATDGTTVLSKSLDFTDCTISKSGFEAVSCADLGKETAAEKDVFLIPSADSQITTIVITGQDDVASSKKIITKDELKRISPGDPTKALRFMPGVQTKGGMGGGGGRGGGGGPGGGGKGGGGGGEPDGVRGQNVTGASSAGEKGAAGASLSTALASNSGLSIRGSAPAESKYYLDDIEVPYVFHSLLDLSIVPGPLVESIQFESGGFSARYGNAMGGIVVLNTPSALAEKGEGEAVVNLPFYSGIYYRAPINDNSTMSVSYRRSYIDYFLNLYLDNSKSKLATSVGTVSPVISDAHIQYLHKGANGSTQKVTLLGVSDGLKVVISSRLLGGGDTNFAFSSKVNGATLAVEQEDFFIESLRYRTTPQVNLVTGETILGDNTFTSTQINARIPTELMLATSENTNVTLGVDPNINTLKSASKIVTQNQTTGESIENNYTSSYSVSNPALWLVANWRLGDFELVPQTRAAYNSQLKKYAADPRLNIAYHLGEMNTLKLAAGRFSMAPTPSQASGESGNSSLSFQNMQQYVLGVETKWTPELTTDAQAYLKEGYKIVNSDPFTRFNNGARTEAWGLEFMARRAFTGRWFAFFSYAFSKTQWRASAQDPFERSPNDQTQVASLAGSYRFFPTWELSGSYKYNTGGVYTPSVGGYYNSASDRYVANPSEEEKNIPAYQAISFYLGKEFLYDTWQTQMRLGMESWWPKIQVSSMQPTYNYSRDIARASLSAIPFFEIKGVF